jgi:hypothetical protein
MNDLLTERERDRLRNIPDHYQYYWKLIDPSVLHTTLDHHSIHEIHLKLNQIPIRQKKKKS